MKYVRWYDEDPYLSQMMKILEHLPRDFQATVAQDLLQIIMSYNVCTDDAQIEYLNKNILPNYRRWYDENANLHSSIELLRTIDPVTKKEICESVLAHLFQIIVEENINNDETI